MVRQTLIYIPASFSSNNPVMQYLLERYDELDTPTFKMFYGAYIIRSNPNQLSFCGGLDSMIKGVSENKNCITLVTIEEVEDSITVYALLIFNVNYIQYNTIGDPVKFTGIFIELLCGNQRLPPSGEATKLLHILEDACFKTEFYDVMLQTTRRSEQYYKDQGYNKNEIYEEEYMVKNLRAVSNWRKVRSHLSESAIGQIDHKSATIKSKQKTERFRTIGRGKKHTFKHIKKGGFSKRRRI
jgi:hypothetical protein